MNAMKSVVVGLLCLATGMAGAVPLYQCPLTVSGYAEGKAALADFPVLVRISTAIDQFNYGDCAAGGADISFTSEDGETVYPHEVDTWNPDGESLVWVKLPSMAHGTKFLFRWNDPNPPSNNDPTQVWPGYIGVWHFSSLVESTTVKNSARNDYDLKFPEGKTGSIAENAPAGMGLFCESGAMRTKNYEPEFSVGANFTATGWFYLPTYSGTSGKYAGFVSKKVGLDWNANTGWYLQMNQSKTTVGLVESSNIETMYTKLPDVTKNWNHFALISDGLSAKAYFNGSEDVNINGKAAIKASSTEFQVGGSGDYIDEYRLRKGAVSVDWAGAEYATVARTDYLTAGTTEIQSLGAVVVSSDGPRYGVVSPAYGPILEPVAGTQYDFSCTVATQLLNEAGTTRAVCTGWELRRLSDGGLIRTSSSEGEQAFACSHTYVQGEGVELMWRWQIQHLVTTKTATTGGGTVEPSEVWVVEGEDVTVTFTPDATHGFYKWTGDVAAASEKTSPLTFTVDGPKTIEAHSMVVAKVTTGEELIAAVAAASATDPSVIKIADGDIYLTETLKLTKPITVRGAGIGKTIVMRDSLLTQLRLLEISNKDATAEGLTFKNGYLNSGTGAGAYVSAGKIVACEFINCHNQPWNTGWNQGGGVKLTGSNSKIVSSVIRNMTVGDGQGEALWLESSAVAESCLICDNKCTTTGRADAYMVKVASATLRGCTVVNNYMGNSVAIYNSNGTIKDCIVYGNTGSVGTVGALGNDGFGIAGNTGSSYVKNTIVTDPGFRDFANGDYSLAAGPAVDAAAYESETLALATVDAAGNPRKTGAAVDIGALECVQDAPECSFIANKTSALEGEEVTFRLFGIGVGDTPEFTVSFGDGTDPVVTSDKSIVHAFEKGGTFTVTVSVTGAEPMSAEMTILPKNLYVKEGGTGTAPYASEDAAAGYIEDALAVAEEGCVIWLAKGDYTLKTKTPIEVKKAVTIRGATGRPEDVKITKMSGGSRIFTLNHASAKLADLTVTGGTQPAQSDHGGNIRIRSTGGTVTNCIIRNGRCGVDTTGGGGVALQGGLVTHCVITNNYGYENGSGVYMTGGRVENCLLVRNDSGSGSHDDGGTVCMEGGKLVNCTIANNTATKCPSICFKSNNAKTIANCLFFGNTSSSLTSDKLCVYVSSAGSVGTFTACAAPFLINSTCFTADDLKVNAEYQLMAKSICRDNATTSGITVPQTDLAGNPRLDEETGLLDIGCYEFHSSGLTAAIASVPAAKSGTISGLTPLAVTFTAETDGGEVAAYRWFVNGVEQEGETEATFATNVTASGTLLVTLKVSDGNQDYDADNTITVKTYPPVLYVNKASTNPVAPYETEATAATFLEDALAAATDKCEIRIAPETYPAKSGAISIGKGVTIRGMGATPADVVLTRKNKSTNHRIFTVNHEGSWITGLTIDNGYMNAQGNHGAGVCIEGRGGTVSNCVIRNSHAATMDCYGGGACLTAANALITHCVITNCSIANSSPGGGTHHGGNGIFMSTGVVRDTLVAFCGSDGTSYATPIKGQDGAIAILGGTVINCTVASNVSATCSGIRARGGKVINTIISANRVTTSALGDTATVMAGKVSGDSSSTTFDHCLADLDVDGKFAVEDPSRTFLRPGKGNFRLRAGSKAIDAGDASAVTSTVDLRGNPRILCGAVDIGCYEKKIGLTVLVK